MATTEREGGMGSSRRRRELVGTRVGPVGIVALDAMVVSFVIAATADAMRALGPAVLLPSSPPGRS